MSASYSRYRRFVRQSVLPAAVLGVVFLAIPAVLMPQSVPPTLESSAARPPLVGPHGEKLAGMPKFHDPAPYDIEEHAGYKQIFAGKSLTGWDADPTSGASKTASWWAKRWGFLPQRQPRLNRPVGCGPAWRSSPARGQRRTSSA